MTADRPTEAEGLAGVPPEAAELTQVVPLLVRTFPEVLGATIDSVTTPAELLQTGTPEAAAPGRATT